MVMIFWGSAFVSGRMLALNHNPVVVAFLRFFLAIFFLMPWLYYKNGRIVPKNKTHFYKFALLGITGVFFYNYFFLSGLKLVEAGRSSVIISFNPVLTYIVAIIFFKEKLKNHQFMGLILGFVGAMIVLSRGDVPSLFTTGVGQGEFYLLMAVFSWIFYTFLGKIFLKKISPHASSAWACLFGLIMFFPFAYTHDLLQSFSRLTMVDFLNLLNLGFFSTFLGFIWFYQAIKELGPSKTSSFINLLPLIGVISGMIILGENPGYSLYLGGAFIISGVFLVNRH